MEINVKQKYSFSQEPKVSRALTVSFITLECCFGFDFGFISSVKKEFQWLLKLIRRLSCLCMFIILAITLPGLESLYNQYYFFDLVHYSIFAIISMIYKYTCYDFFIKIVKITEDIPIKIQISFILYGFIIIFGKIVYSIVLYFVEHGRYISILPEYVYMIPSSALDAAAIAAAIIFYYVYNSVSYLKKSYETSTNEDELLKRYIDIAECYDKVKPSYSAMIFLQIITNVPKLMMSIYYSIAYNKEKTVSSVVSQAIFLSHLVVQLCIPSFAGELVDSEVEALKLMLNNQLIAKRDTKSEAAIRRVLGYMAARPLKHRVCRLLTTDLRLPVSVFSFCITYMIVVLQITHLV